MAEVNPPAFQTGECYTAADFRGLIASLVCGEGVATTEDGALEVTPVAGSFAVEVAAGEAFIAGDLVEAQGMYWVNNDGPVVLEVEPSDPTDPRIDLVVATVNDAEFLGTENSWVLQVIEGIPSPVPAEPDIPPNSLILARLDIPAGATPPVEVTDARTDFYTCGSFPPTLLTYAGAVGSENTFTFNKADHPGMSAIKVTVIGGGGSGGLGYGFDDLNGTAYSGWGAGGGSGGLALGYFSWNDLPDSVEFVCGAGGAGGEGGQPSGSSGTASKFLTLRGGGGDAGTDMDNTGTDPVIVAGGDGGTYSAPGSRGARGAPGQPGMRLNGTVGQGGNGGTSFIGGAGRGVRFTGPGQDGASGSGGGGSAAVNTAPTLGDVSAGGPGVVMIEVF